MVEGASVLWGGLLRSQAVVHEKDHLSVCVGWGQCWEETAVIATV